MASLVVPLCLVIGFVFSMITPVSSVTRSDSGAGIVYKLHVKQDVSLESPRRNHNRLPFLMVGKHTAYPNKRSLVQFEDLPLNCSVHKIKWAKMYLYYMYSHKASFHSVQYTPFITRYFKVYRVKKSWNETQATSTIRYGSVRWSKPLLGLDNCDAERRPQSCWAVPLYTNHPRKTWIEFDVTRAVNYWRRYGRNYGLVVRATNEYRNGRGTRFASNADRDRKRHAFINVLCGY